MKKKTAIKRSPTKIPKMKPCPFCGSDEHIKYYDGSETRLVGWEDCTMPTICCECGIGFYAGIFGSGVNEHKRESIVVTEWNRRTRSD